MAINKTQKIYIAASLFVIVVLSYTLLKIQDKTPSTFAVQQPKEEFVKIIPDTVEINKADLKYCCEFTDESKKWGCWLMKRYSCDYCSTYCEAQDE